jgi:hypothetical protein
MHGKDLSRNVTAHFCQHRWILLRISSHQLENRAEPFGKSPKL